MGNRITRKNQRNAADLAVQDHPGIPTANTRYDIRPFGDKFVPWDTLTNHVPLGYTQGYPDIPACLKAIETSLALNF